MHSRKSLIRRTRCGYRLDNGILAREIEIRRGVLKTMAMVNHLTGGRFAVRSREWDIALNGRQALSADDFRVAEVSRQAGPGGEETLAVRLINEACGLRLTVCYAIAPQCFFMRKTIRIESGHRLVRSVAVESFTATGGLFTMGGFGQPLFMNAEVFLGLEYPAGYNEADRQPTVRLTHYPGRAGTIDCKSAVWGVCPNTVNNRIRDWFLKYIEMHRARVPRRLHTQYCASNRSIASWKLGVAKRLFADQGLPVDALYVHSGENIYERQSVSRLLPESRQKPNLSVLRKHARRMIGAGLGFHINTGGGRGSADHAWFRQNFDMISPSYYCLADPRVKEQLQRNLTELIRKYDAECLSFDWLWWKTAWECPHAGHRGHIAGAKYGREAITDAFIDMAKAWRRAKPDIILEDLEIEHSPWWLLYADALWTVAGEGPGVVHQMIDGSLRGWTKTTVFPMNSVWYAVNPPYGWSPRPWPPPDAAKIPPEKLRRYAEQLRSGGFMIAGKTPPREWADNVIMSFLRGSQINEIYYLIEYLTAEERRLYAEIMRWALKNQEILLANTTFILGNPARNETYGLAHFLENNRGIIGIYNPCPWRNDTVRLKLDETAHFYRAGRAVDLDVVYPFRKIAAANVRYGDTIELTVPGKSLVVLETRVARNAPPARPRQFRIENPLPAETNFAVRNHAVKRAGSGKIRIEFDLIVPIDEQVRLYAFTETDYKPGVFLANAGARKLYQAAYAEGMRRNVRGWQKIGEARDMSQEAVLRQYAVGRDTGAIIANGRAAPLASGADTYYRIIRTGRHPMRWFQRYAFSRFWAEKPLRPGRIDVSLRMRWPHAKCRIWLEREGGQFGRPGKTLPGQLPADWHGGFREVVTVLE